MDTLVVVTFHTNIANRWLFMIQKKYSLTFSIHKVILTCLGAVFSGHGVHYRLSHKRNILADEMYSTVCVVMIMVADH